jgi:hypothetical protein
LSAARVCCNNYSIYARSSALEPSMSSVIGLNRLAADERGISAIETIGGKFVFS